MSDSKTYAAVLIRRLREGKTYDDFVEAWYPDKGFGFSEGWGPVTARNASDPQEILTLAMFKLAEGESLDEAMARIGSQEAVRHDRLDDVIESTTANGMYEVLDEFDFSSDESVAAGRPASVRDRAG